MLTRFSLFVTVAFFTTHPAFAKDKGYYLPMGYNALWKPRMLQEESKEEAKKETNEPSMLQGARVGVIGYTFSEDFRIELTGVGYLEKLANLVAQQSTKHPEPQSVPLPTSIPATKPTRKQHTPHPSLSKLPSDPIFETPRPPVRACSQNLPPTPLLKEYDPTYNVWEAGNTPKASQIITKNSDTLIEDTTIEDSNAPLTSSQSDPGVEERGADQITGVEHSPFVKPQEIITEQPTTIEPPAQSLPEPPQSTPAPSKIIWSGATLAGKWTWLHLHPQFRLYWGPGLTFLYPHHDKVRANCFISIGVGCHWIINSKLSLDCSGYRMLKVWGDSSEVKTLFSENKLTNFSIGLNWHF